MQEVHVICAYREVPSRSSDCIRLTPSICSHCTPSRVKDMLSVEMFCS